MSHKFYIEKIHEGHCNITYRTKNPLNQTVYYCLQENRHHPDKVEFFRATLPPWYEPNYQCHPEDSIYRLFEVPKGDGRTEVAIREFLIKKTQESSNDII